MASTTHWFLFPQSRMTFDPLWTYGFDMFMFCVNAASITTPFASLPLPPLPSPPLSSPLLYSSFPPFSQAGGVHLGGALAPQGGPGVPQYAAMGQCGAPLGRRRAQHQHPPPPAPHQVLHHCLQVRAHPAVQQHFIIMTVNMVHSGTVVVTIISSSQQVSAGLHLQMKVISSLMRLRSSAKRVSFLKVVAFLLLAEREIAQSVAFIYKS